MLIFLVRGILSLWQTKRHIKQTQYARGVYMVEPHQVEGGFIVFFAIYFYVASQYLIPRTFGGGWRDESAPTENPFYIHFNFDLMEMFFHIKTKCQCAVLRACVCVYTFKITAAQRIFAFIQFTLKNPVAKLI